VRVNKRNCEHIIRILHEGYEECEACGKIFKYPKIEVSE